MSTGKLKKKTETKKLIYIPALLALLVLSILLSASIGQVEIPLSDTFKILMERLFHVKLAGYAEIPSAYFNVVWMIRFPRALIAAAVGIGLSLCGIVMQAAVENPLADPYILGISSGATLGATFALMVGVGTLPLIGQFNELAFDFSVQDMVLMGRSPHKKMMEGYSEADYKLVEDTLRKTELYPLRQRSYLSLSGGEKQRVILARAIVQQPELLILDEPTNHLDIKFQFEVLDLVKDLNISTLCVLHNIELSARYCDYLYAMKQGRIIAEGAPNKLITKETIRTIYDVESEIYTNPITQDLAVAFLPTRYR